MRTTRRGFGRKVVLFGIAVFTAIALTATGFAAWLISNDAQNQQAGNISGASVQEASIKITINIAPSEKLMFAPKADDHTGQVRHDGNESVFEDLEISSLQGTVTGIDKMGNLSISIRIPDAVLYAAGYTWTVEDGTRVYGFDKTKAFVSLPGYAMDVEGNPIPKIENGVLTENYTAAVDFVRPTGSVYASTTSAVEPEFSITVGDNNTLTFVSPMSFGWGVAFNSLNPGVYYDTDVETEVDGVQVMAPPENCTNVITSTLNIMNAMMYNVNLGDVEYTEENDDLTSTVWTIDFAGEEVAAKDFVLPTSENGVLKTIGSLDKIVIKSSTNGVTEEYKPLVEGTDELDYDAIASKFNMILEKYMDDVFMATASNQPQYVVFVAATVNK